MKWMLLALTVASVVSDLDVVESVSVAGKSSDMVVSIKTSHGDQPIRISRKDASLLGSRLEAAIQGEIHYAFSEENRKLKTQSGRLSFKNAWPCEVVGGESYLPSQKFECYFKSTTVCLTTFPAGVRKVAEDNLSEIECCKYDRDPYNRMYEIRGKGNDGKNYLISYTVPIKDD